GDRLGTDLDDGDDVAQVPVIGVGELPGVAVVVEVAVAPRRGPLDETAQHRAASRAGAAAAGEERELLRRRLLAEGCRGGEGQGGKAGSGRSEAAGRGKGVARRHPHGLRTAGPLTDAGEVLADALGELGLRRAEAAVRLGVPDLV